jgi:hypothetical protein
VRAPENADLVAVLKSRLGEARERYLRLELEVCFLMKYPKQIEKSKHLFFVVFLGEAPG